MHTLHFFAGFFLALAGLFCVVYAQYFHFPGDEPFNSDTANQLWGALMPYLLAIAIVVAIGGAVLMKKSGVDFDWPSR